MLIAIEELFVILVLLAIFVVYQPTATIDYTNCFCCFNGLNRTVAFLYACNGLLHLLESRKHLVNESWFTICTIIWSFSFELTIRSGAKSVVPYLFVMHDIQLHLFIYIALTGLPTKKGLF